VLTFGAAVAVSGVVAWLWLLIAAVAGCGATSTAGRVGVNTLAIRSTPSNRGGATSMTLAWQFLGSALAPLVLLPVYHLDPRWAFAATAVTALPAAALFTLPSTPSEPTAAPVRADNSADQPAPEPPLHR
jgi:ACDE family multidrug resistance protein